MNTLAKENCLFPRRPAGADPGAVSGRSSADGADLHHSAGAQGEEDGRQ